MIGTFILGALSIIPAAALETWLIDDSVFSAVATLASVATVMFFVVGPVEEFSKFLAVRFGAARSRYFEETMDGLVYAAAASFGFASAENISYAFQYGPEVMLQRGPISTVAHFAFGALWGVALGARAEGRVGRTAIVGGLAAAAAMHGLFNVLVFTGTGVGIVAAISLMIIGAVIAQRMFARARLHSPHRLRRNVPHAICRCGNNERLAHAGCSVCDRPLGRAINLVCGHCGTMNAGTAHYCSRCGDQFVPAARRPAISR
jgi:RsiW-degrading membrane proteinase PrsW (M82 family)